MTASAESMRIVHIDAETGFSGGEVQVFLLIDGLEALGQRNVLVCPPRSGAEQEAKRRRIETTPVRMRNDVDLPAVVALTREMRRRRPDVVHLHTGRATWLGGLAAWLAGIPAVTTRRMDRRVNPGWRTRLIYERLTRRVAAISPAVADCLVEGGVRAERICVISDAVDPQRLQPSAHRNAVRVALGAGPNDSVVLALAALIPRKGLDVLLDALVRLGGQGLRPVAWIAGEGPERGRLEDQSSRLGLRGQVQFLGKRADVADLLGACDLFVIPSRREGMGVAALEAMAAGRAVVASEVGGLREAIADGHTGLLVPAGDAAALAQAVAKLLGDGGLRERMGTAGAERVQQKFLPGQMVAAYVDLYRTVLEEAKGGRRVQ